jgi:hypothetical protein
MSKHTPGPWAAGRADMQTIVEGYPCKWIYGPDDSYLALASGRASDNWDEVMANARLIAAAPALLAFAERVLARWHSHDGQLDRIDDALAALAAATGKESEDILRQSESAVRQMLKELYGEDTEE